MSKKRPTGKDNQQPIAPNELVLQVALRSGRSISTVKRVIYGDIKSSPVQKVIDQVRKEMEAARA